MHFDTGVVIRHLPQLWSGFELTVLLVVSSLVIGVFLGAVACFGKLLGRGLLYWMSVVYVAVTRSIPEMVAMFWIYYCAPLVLYSRLSSREAAITSMSLYAGAFLAEIFRAGILAVPRGQTEAARALGIPEGWIWLEVITPQALRMMIPAFIGLVTLIVKVSGIASAIGAAELVYQATIISGQSYRYFEMFSAVGVFYFVLIFPLSLLAQYYERRLARKMR